MIVIMMGMMFFLCSKVVVGHQHAASQHLCYAAALEVLFHSLTFQQSLQQRDLLLTFLPLLP